jgi:hypothetical protein
VNFCEVYGRQYFITREDAFGEVSRNEDFAPVNSLALRMLHKKKPVDFTTTPSLAVPMALQNAGAEASDVDYHEIKKAVY